ncbi:MAG: HNH endonuclease signature motif containing protein [Leucobacter sp.]
MKNHLSRQVLDLRRLSERNAASGSSMRFMDQKTTPDIIWSTAYLLRQTKIATDWFAVQDLWDTPDFAAHYESAYGKPDVDLVAARHEYDKVIVQPLKTLAFAGVLEERMSGRRLEFRLLQPEILAELTESETTAFRFLRDYLTEVLTQSGEYGAFERYRDSQHLEADYQRLKRVFTDFLLRETRINGVTEVRRIFPKVLNPLAANWRIPGSHRGHVARFRQTQPDLSYNQQNARDLRRKAKHQPRSTVTYVPARESVSALEKANVAAVRQRGRRSSEVFDALASGSATHVHHIVPRSMAQDLRATRENLILLTASQHNTRAHPENVTGEIDLAYQVECLLAKADTIARTLAAGDDFYSVHEFARVVARVVSPTENMSHSAEFDVTSVDLDRLRNAIAEHRESL